MGFVKNAVCLLLMAVASPASIRSDDRSVFDDWVGHKLPAAQKPLKLADSSSFTSNFVLEMETSTGGPAVSFKLHSLHKASGDNTLLGSYATDVRPTGAELRVGQKCFGVNSRYYYELGRNKRGDAWLLERILGHEAASDPSAKTMLDVIRRENKPYFEMLMSCKLLAGPTQASDLTKLPGFVLLSAKPTPDNNAIDIAYAYSQAMPDNAPSVNVNCTVRYDLGMYGLPTETAELSGEASNLRTVKESQKLVSFDGKTCVVETERSQTGTLNNKLVYSSKARSKGSVVLGRLPESEFTLAAFGLPEPPGFEPQRTPLYVWLMAATAACLVLFFLFRSLARRRASA